MKRWLALLMLLGSSSGCMMLEDMLFVDDAPPSWTTQEPPAGTCGQPLRNVTASQTAEPELLQR